jgi:hypothetical protein
MVRVGAHTRAGTGETGFLRDRNLVRRPASLDISIQYRFWTGCFSEDHTSSYTDSLRHFFPPVLSPSESPFWLPSRYGEGLLRSFVPNLALVAASREAPRRVEPLKPRQEERCGAYRFEATCRRSQRGLVSLEPLTGRPQTRQSKNTFPLTSILPLPLPIPVAPPVPFSGPTT